MFVLLQPAKVWIVHKPGSGRFPVPQFVYKSPLTGGINVAWGNAFLRRIENASGSSLKVIFSKGPHPRRSVTLTSC
jgi:hypothetical protein